MAVMQVHLTLIGDDFDTAYVTGETGMQPDYLREKDEVLPSGRLFGHTEWGIETERVQSDDLEELLTPFISRISCESSTLLRLCDECSAEWHLLILVEIYDDYSPALYFSTEIVRFAASINAQIGFDTYVCSTDGVEEYDIE